MNFPRFYMAPGLAGPGVPVMSPMGPVPLMGAQGMPGMAGQPLVAGGPPQLAQQQMALHARMRGMAPMSQHGMVAQMGAPGLMGQPRMMMGQPGAMQGLATAMGPNPGAVPQLMTQAMPGVAEMLPQGGADALVMQGLAAQAGYMDGSENALIPSERDPDEPEANPTAVVLDHFNSDLSLKIDVDGYSGEALTAPSGFCFCWAGIRATYGVTKGRICYEVLITEYLPVDFGEDHIETDPHVIRVGWSTDSSSFQLGEEPNSYGFGGTGKFSSNSKFIDYGERFGKGDVIMAMLDLETKPPSISYAKNGRWFGVAVPLHGHPIGQRNAALFPHILSKNCRFEVNFGQREPWFPPAPGYMYIGQLPPMERVRGSVAPPKKSDCEMIMIVGLPGAGKTTWGINMAKNFPDKHYNIIGTDTLIEKMKVMGLPRKRNYNGRWEVLIQKATRCLNSLFTIGSKRRRNYILDQTNVYASARKRKLRHFEGFRRVCAVLVTTDPELEKRSTKRTHEDGKYVPEEAVLEMKANFTLPSEEDEQIDDILWIEQPRSEADPLVAIYNKEGQERRPVKEFRQNPYGAPGQRENRPMMRGGPPEKRSRVDSPSERGGGALGMIKQEYEDPIASQNKSAEAWRQQSAVRDQMEQHKPWSGTFTMKQEPNDRDFRGQIGIGAQFGGLPNRLVGAGILGFPGVDPASFELQQQQQNLFVSGMVGDDFGDSYSNKLGIQGLPMSTSALSRLSNSYSDTSASQTASFSRGFENKDFSMDVKREFGNVDPGYAAKRMGMDPFGGARSVGASATSRDSPSYGIGSQSNKANEGTDRKWSDDRSMASHDSRYSGLDSTFDSGYGSRIDTPDSGSGRLQGDSDSRGFNSRGGDSRYGGSNQDDFKQDRDRFGRNSDMKDDNKRGMDNRFGGAQDRFGSSSDSDRRMGNFEQERYGSNQGRDRYSGSNDKGRDRFGNQDKDRFRSDQDRFGGNKDGDSRFSSKDSRDRGNKFGSDRGEGPNRYGSEAEGGDRFGSRSDGGNRFGASNDGGNRFGSGGDSGRSSRGNNRDRNDSGYGSQSFDQRGGYGRGSDNRDDRRGQYGGGRFDGDKDERQDSSSMGRFGGQQGSILGSAPGMRPGMDSGSGSGSRNSSERQERKRKSRWGPSEDDDAGAGSDNSSKDNGKPSFGGRGDDMQMNKQMKPAVPSLLGTPPVGQVPPGLGRLQDRNKGDIGMNRGPGGPNLPMGPQGNSLLGAPPGGNQGDRSNNRFNSGDGNNMKNMDRPRVGGPPGRPGLLGAPPQGDGDNNGPKRMPQQKNEMQVPGGMNQNNGNPQGPRFGPRVDGGMGPRGMVPMGGGIRMGRGGGMNPGFGSPGFGGGPQGLLGARPMQEMGGMGPMGGPPGVASLLDMPVRQQFQGPGRGGMGPRGPMRFGRPF